MECTGTVISHEKFTCNVCPCTYPNFETVTKKLMECAGTDISHGLISSHVMSVPVLTQGFRHGQTTKMERLNFVSVLTEWTEISSKLQGIQIHLRH